MCGRFSNFTPIEVLRVRFRDDPPDEPVYPRYNAAPGQKLIVIPMDDPHKMHFYKWVLIPPMGQDPRDRKQLDQRPFRNPERKTCFPRFASKRKMPGPG